RPSRRGDAANDAMLQKAVQNYQTAAEKLLASPDPKDKSLGRLSLDYLRAAYEADKLNDPAKAEEAVLRMVQLDPNETSNYFALAKIYEDAGAYPEAEQMLQLAREVRQKDANVYLKLAGFYKRQGAFEKTLTALQQRAS